MTTVTEPLYDVAHLAHIELLTPKPEESLHFFTHLLSLQEVGWSGQSVYLRAYGDYAHYTLKLTEAKSAGLGHVAWRTTSPAALERRVQALAAQGCGRGWVEGEGGDGPAYQFVDPDGHLFELFYETTH